MYIYLSWLSHLRQQFVATYGSITIISALQRSMIREFLLCVAGIMTGATCSQHTFPCCNLIAIQANSTLSDPVMFLHRFPHPTLIVHPAFLLPNTGGGLSRNSKYPTGWPQTAAGGSCQSWWHAGNRGMQAYPSEDRGGGRRTSSEGEFSLKCDPGSNAQ